MATVGFREARDCVIQHVRGQASGLSEEVDLESAAGRVLAEEICADRDYPPLDRSVRDGFAVHAADLPGALAVIGEVRAGEISSAEVKRGEALEIMTGAPMPKGADAVIMVEYVRREGNRIATDRAISSGEAVNPRGSEVREGARLLSSGQRLGFAEVAMLAAVGRLRARVYRRPVVAILATGDEIVEINQQPLPFQIRNSNAYSLAAQVRRSGGVPRILPVACDNYDSTRSLIERGLEDDLLLVSGGVSAGKYDIVERVLAELGAEFFFDRVLIQPGQPLVFGRVRGKFVFGLPGNPVSTMVTFEIFARAAMELLEGQDQPLLPLTLARLSQDVRQKTGLTRFLPAQLSPDGAELTPLHWTGSSDVPALTRANAFLVTEAGRESWKAGDMIQVMLK